MFARGPVAYQRFTFRQVFMEAADVYKLSALIEAPDLAMRLPILSLSYGILEPFHIPALSHVGKGPPSKPHGTLL
jgi:hypothetical protein